MTRFTITLPPDLNTWLEAQAWLNHRSKSGQVAAFLSQLKSQQENRPRFSMADEQWGVMKGNKRK